MNELNLYRYDVLILCNQKKRNIPTINSINWDNIENPEIEIPKQISKIKSNDILEIDNIPNIRYTAFEEYRSLFIENRIALNKLKATSISFFLNLANKGKLNSQSCFVQEDVFKFIIQFSKNKMFKTQKLKITNYSQLSNKWQEKKTVNDKAIEVSIINKHPELELIKVSNYLISNIH